MLKASLIEFGNNSYKNTSINDICKKYNISKGLIIIILKIKMIYISYFRSFI